MSRSTNKRVDKNIDKLIDKRIDRPSDKQVDKNEIQLYLEQEKTKQLQLIRDIKKIEYQLKQKETYIKQPKNYYKQFNDIFSSITSTTQHINNKDEINKKTKKKKHSNSDLIELYNSINNNSLDMSDIILNNSDVIISPTINTKTSQTLIDNMSQCSDVSILLEEIDVCI